ncbi:helix-turn-helix domain-containing protein [Nitrospirillum amazonense]|uniref:AraC family transcriptional regulator n=1 Tax=Nitrospirillum amazonense TaxID=28077 RepID=A0A560K2S4_9PROT|nr:AraC family transcriptional regulator [Nitrospirillum amazonense]MDG3444090.1 AraC family transcriptional regulator [Nitrospirillum amazonense]TWB77645.1 AraC family transcriptional regulator [Nitrospirillum amazonense]
MMDAGQGNIETPAATDTQWIAAVVVKLLDDAGDILDSDRDAARVCIARAAAFLRGEAAPAAGRTDGARREAKGFPPAVPARPATTEPLRGGLAPWQIRRVISHIDANLAGAIRMDDCATVTRLSTRYFSRAFKSSFGVPPHTYVVQRRIQQAQHLMLTTQEPLCQIALACGLCDQAHFSKLFRRVVGLSPSTWRRQWRDAPLEPVFQTEAA